MSLEKSIDGLTAQIAELNKLLAGAAVTLTGVTEAVGDVSRTEVEAKVEPEAKKTVDEAAVEDTQKQEAEDTTSEPEADTSDNSEPESGDDAEITLDDVRGMLSKVATNVDTATARAALRNVGGVSKASELPKEKYQAVYQALEAELETL